MTYQPTLGYIAFYNRNRIELYANSLLIAKTRAIAYFNVPKSKHGRAVANNRNTILLNGELPCVLRVLRKMERGGSDTWSVVERKGFLLL